MTTAVRLPYDIFDRNDTLYSYILTFFMPQLTVGTTPPLIVRAFDSSVLDPVLWPILNYGSEWTVRQNSNTFEVIILNPTNYEPWDKLQVEASEAYERTVDAPVNYNKNATDTEGDYQTRLIQQVNGRLTYLERHVWTLIGTVRPPNEKGRIIMIDDATGHAIFRGCNLLQMSDGTISGSTDFNIFSDVFAYNAVIDQNLRVGNNLTVVGDITGEKNLLITGNINGGKDLSVTGNATIGGTISVTGNAILSANLSVAGLTTCNNLTVSADSNLNYIYANSAVITVIESNDILSDKGTISNLETVQHLSNNVTTDTLTVNTVFNIPSGSEFNANGSRFGWNIDLTNTTKINLILGVVNGKTVITNDIITGGGPGNVVLKHDTSGVLSGFTSSFINDIITINPGMGVVWNGTAYQEITMSAPVGIQVSLTADSYVLLRWDGAGSLEAYTQATPPSNDQKVQDIYLLFVTAHGGNIFNLFNRFRNLNQQLEQVIDILGLAVPYSNMIITLTDGTANFVRTAGNFKAFGIRNVPTTAAKYDTSTIFNIADNAPIFALLDIYRGNSSIDLTDFPFPPQYLNNNALVDIPTDSWGYYEVLVNAYGQVRFIYPIDVFISLEPNSGDAQQSLKDLTAIKDFKVEGFAVIGMLGLKGGATVFDPSTSIFYQNIAQIGGAATVVEINLPDPNSFNEGDRMTVIDVGGGVKEWYGMPDNVQTGAVGKPAYYDTVSTIASSVDHLVPDPVAGDIDKVLGVTGAGTIGWIDQATGSGGSGIINPGTIGNPAVYTAAEEIGSSTDQLVHRPLPINTGQIYTALGEGSAGWRDFTGSIDSIVITKIISDSQQAGDILTTLSKRRLFDSGVRIYDNYSRREILALNGQTISLKQYIGFGIKADIIPAAPQPGDEPPDPSQGTGEASTTYRHVRFTRTSTNEKYVLEIIGNTWDTAVTSVHLGTVNHKTGLITRVHTHTSWAQTGVVSRATDFGIFFVVDVVNNYYGFNVYTGGGAQYHYYFYNLTTGVEIHSEITNKWDLLTIPAYITKNDHLYVFYLRNRSVFSLDRIKIQGSPPYWTVVQDAVVLYNAYLFQTCLKMVDESTGLISTLRYASGSSCPSHMFFNFDTNTVGNFYTVSNTVNRPLCYGGILYDNKFSLAYYLFNGQANQRIVQTLESNIWELVNDLPGVANVGYSCLDQHPKYTNICACLKNDKRQLFLSYDYGMTWIEKAGFNGLTQFWPTNPPTGAGGVTDYRIPSKTIWLDENNTNMIFAGWLLNGGTNAPLVIQPLGVTAGEATLPVWDDGCYIISTEYQYQPVTWFDAGGGLVIGETYHSRKMPLAKTVNGIGKVSDIDWALGTTPPSIVAGFACSHKTIGSWAASNKSVYYAADGYSFGHVYTAAENVYVSHVAYYDESRCLVATYQTDPFNSTNIALVNTDGNVQVIYNVSSPYPIVADLIVTDNYIIFSRVGVNQVVWADINDLIFGAVTVGDPITKLASAGLTTHGVSADGTMIYEWSGKGDTEMVLRTFTGGAIINDIASEPGKLFAVGYTGADGDAYVYNYTAWTDYLAIGTANHFNVVEISTTNISDVIIAGQNGFFASSDGFDTEPVVLPIDQDSVQPIDVKTLSIDTTEAFTVFFGVDGNDQGFNYRAGSINTSIITDLLEHRYSSVMVGTTPMGYVIFKKPADDFWTRKMLRLISGSAYTQRQTIAEGLNGAIYIQDDEGHIGVSTDSGGTFNVAAASPIGESNRGGAFIGGLLGNTSILALGGGRMIKSNDDWATSVEWSPYNPDQSCTYFSRDLARNNIVYVAVSQKGTGPNVCRVDRFNATDSWVAPTHLLDITLDGGRYFTRIASYNDRIVVVQSDGAIRYSIDGGLTWSAEDTSIIDTPAENEGVTSIWLENTTDCVYIAKTGGVHYNTFVGLETGEPWIQEDVPVSASQKVGAHLVDKKRVMGIIGNVGVELYQRRYDT